MFRIGCHLSSSKGFLAMAKQAEEIGANTFQFFTRNPRGGKAKDLDVKDIAAYQQYAAEHGIGQTKRIQSAITSTITKVFTIIRFTLTESLPIRSTFPFCKRSA